MNSESAVELPLAGAYVFPPRYGRWRGHAVGRLTLFEFASNFSCAILRRTDLLAGSGTKSLYETKDL